MVLPPAAIQAAEDLGRSLAPPTDEEGALLRLICQASEDEQARAS